LPIWDGANYFETAASQFNAWKDGGLIDFTTSLWQSRGWRPISFPAFISPLLILTNGSIYGSAVVLTILQVIAVQTSLFLLLRCFVSPLASGLGALCIGLFPFLVELELSGPYAEPTWLAALNVFLGIYIRWSRGAISWKWMFLAGLSASIAMSLRPIETLAILPWVPAIQYLRSWRQGKASRVGFIVASTLIVASTSVVTLSTQSSHAALFLFASALLSISLLLWTMRGSLTEVDRAVVLLVATFAVTQVGWWFSFTPKLVAWAFATSLGSLAEVTDSPTAPLSNLVEVTSFYAGSVGLWGLIIATALLAGCCFKNFRRDAARLLRSSLGAFLLAFTLPTLAAYLITGTSDFRRLLPAIVLALVLMLSLALLPGHGMRFRYAMVALVVAGELVALTRSALGAAQPEVVKGLHVPGIASPRTLVTYENEALTCLLANGVTAGETVGVFTSASLHPNLRVYEPNSLSMLAELRGFNINHAYFADDGNYSSVLTRLRSYGARILMVDDLRIPNDPSGDRPPSVTVKQILSIQSAGQALPGLQLVDRCYVGGRRQWIYAIVPGPLISN
jgi:hypothetical protein